MSEQDYVGGLTAWAMVWTDRLVWCVIIYALLYTGNAWRKDWTGESRIEKQRECFLNYYGAESRLDEKEATADQTRALREPQTSTRKGRL